MVRTVPRQSAVPRPLAAEALAALESARARTLALLSHLSDGDLERAFSPIVGPLVWDLAHIAAYEDLWLAHRLLGLDLLRPDLAELYDAFETPRAVRGEVELLSPVEACAYMKEVRGRVARALGGGLGDDAGVGKDGGLGVGGGVRDDDGLLAELVLRHELQHSETMRQTMALAGLLPPGEPMTRPLAGEDGWLEVPAGSFMMGAPAEGFAYDNERPRHLARTPAFAIALRPATNESWMRFSEGGGYERREWWSREGWAWKEEYDITHHSSAAAGPPEAPVCHVSWFEADAYARAHGARLPTEDEWERAATLRPDALGGVGEVWEWTASPFRGYPGFVAHPYREYSEVFFGDDYRVLRGHSWATSPRVASVTFRNWDYPVRRQIFAGVRLARDGEA
jgi:gamma-glutamyl hercynylcysteine S-oxide synthase